jgi:hypothetical protein
MPFLELQAGLFSVASLNTPSICCLHVAAAARRPTTVRNAWPRHSQTGVPLCLIQNPAGEGALKTVQGLMSMATCGQNAYEAAFWHILASQSKAPQREI